MLRWIECSFSGFLLMPLVLFVSERCQQEIDKVLQDNETINYDTRNQMPYMQVCTENMFPPPILNYLFHGC